jgi:hypothetical protein
VSDDDAHNYWLRRINERQPAYASLMKLREDAVKVGMFDLAVAYGWSALRLSGEALKERSSDG